MKLFVFEYVGPYIGGTMIIQGGNLDELPLLLSRNKGEVHTFVTDDYLVGKMQVMRSLLNVAAANDEELDQRLRSSCNSQWSHHPDEMQCSLMRHRLYDELKTLVAQSPDRTFNASAFWQAFHKYAEVPTLYLVESYDVLNRRGAQIVSDTYHS